MERQVVLVRNMSEGTGVLCWFFFCFFSILMLIEAEFNVKTDEDVENLITTLEQQAYGFFF